MTHRLSPSRPVAGVKGSVGVTLTDISHLLGHASTAVTEAVYIHRQFDDQRVAGRVLERIFSQRARETWAVIFEVATDLKGYRDRDKSGL